MTRHGFEAGRPSTKRRRLEKVVGTVGAAMDLRNDWPAVLRHSWLGGAELHEEMDSTNAQALRYINSSRGLSLPYLIVAERQTFGRGRGGNLWYSSQGALTFSLIVELPKESWLQRAPLSLLVGTAICEALVPWCGETVVRLKWPNDIYVGQRKMAGILIEASGAPLRTYVVGIGINVGNSFEQAPAEVQSRAISLNSCTHALTTPSEVLEAVLDRIQDLFDGYQNSDGTDGRPWDRFCLLQHNAVTVRTSTGLVQGVCRGARQDGALVVVDSDHRMHIVHSGEVIAFDTEGST